MSKKARKQQQISTDTPETVSNLVKPLIREGDKKHALEVLFEGDPEKVPVLKSIGFGPIGEGNAWVSYVLTSKGKEVLSIEVSEPNLRQIAEESAKTDFVTNFMDQGI